MREHCWNNRPEPKSGYWAQDGWEFHDIDTDGMPRSSSPRWVWIPNVMTKKCGQPGKDLPPAEGCVGCKFLGEQNAK